MRKVRSKGQAGQAMVEFGLVILVFMIVVIGIIDVSRAVWNYNTLSNAVREGARYGIVHGEHSSDPAGPTANNADLEAQVEDFAGGLNLSELTVTSTWPDGDNSRGSRVRVSGSYDFEPMLGSVFGLGSVTMTSVSTMNITN